MRYGMSATWILILIHILIWILWEEFQLNKKLFMGKLFGSPKKSPKFYILFLFAPFSNFPPGTFKLNALSRSWFAGFSCWSGTEMGNVLSARAQRRRKLRLEFSIFFTSSLYTRSLFFMKREKRKKWNVSRFRSSMIIICRCTLKNGWENISQRTHGNRNIRNNSNRK